MLGSGLDGRSPMPEKLAQREPRLALAGKWDLLEIVDRVRSGHLHVNVLRSESSSVA